MRLRLTNEAEITSFNPADGMGWILVKVISLEEKVVEVDARQTFAHPEQQDMPHPDERWTLIDQIRPGYLAGACVEVIAPDRGGWKVKLIHTVKPMPRNAQFSRTFTVRKNHLAGRA